MAGPFYPEAWDSTMRPAIRDAVVAELGGSWAVYWSDQDAPRASRPAAVLKALDLPHFEGRPYVIDVDAAPTRLDQEVHVTLEWTLEIQLEADTDQRALFENLRLGLFQTAQIERFAAAGLVVVQERDARDLSQIFSGRRDWRSALDLRMRMGGRRVFTDQPWIETTAPVVVEVR